MDKYYLHEGQTDVRLEVEIDYEDGGQISIAELDAADSIKIYYKFKDLDDSTNDKEGDWDVTGYFLDDGKVVVYYNFGKETIDIDDVLTEVDVAVPDNCSVLLGRVIVVDGNGKISKGKQFSINVLKSELE